MSSVPEAPICPYCRNALIRCTGNPEMPASQEFWKCCRCGLNAHISRFVTEQSRAELEREYSKSLRQRIDDGLAAQKLLNACARTYSETRRPSPMVMLCCGIITGIVLGRLFTKR